VKFTVHNLIERERERKREREREKTTQGIIEVPSTNWK